MNDVQHLELPLALVASERKTIVFVHKALL